MESQQLKEKLLQIVRTALLEDLGSGDHSSMACIPDSAKGKSKLLVKQDCFIAGVEMARIIAEEVDEELVFEQIIEDGAKVLTGNEVFRLEGNSRSILKAERLILNCMQRMSAIATETRKYADKIAAYNCKVLDTRKTTPGLRAMEKWAVRIGGGVNHRMGLYDMIMLKDNHLDFAGGIEQAINKTKEYLVSNRLDLQIEVEARNLFEVEQILEYGPVDRIMLDNFNYEDTKAAVNLIKGESETESSGGITLETIEEYAKCGVDFISVGALTHGVKNVDLSLKAL